MLPLESVSRSWQPPEPIVPFSVSPPMVPVAVTGSSPTGKARDTDTAQVNVKAKPVVTG